MPIEPTSFANLAAANRELLPTALGSAGMRDAIAADVRANSVFVSRCGEALVLQQVKDVVEAVTAGTMDEVTARWLILESLRATGYTPEGGFPTAEPGTVPPALRGTLQDLSSMQRLSLIVRTQVDLCRGRGQQARGLDPDRMEAFPAYELVRVLRVRMPRNWGGKFSEVPTSARRDPRPRWTIAGGDLTEGRMIALKGDPIWGELGSSGNFDDALDVDYPPFAFNSGMGWREVSMDECLALGVTGPDGQAIAEWIGADHPLLVNTQSGIPAPQVAVKQLDPGLKAWFEKSSGITIVEGTATTPGNKAEVLAVLAQRREARAARHAERMLPRPSNRDERSVLP